jgi:hypothetical protein
MQMVAIGAADTHLTANASVTFFRTRVQKCTNFAYESIQQKFNGATWGSEMHVTLNRTGDLIYWMYVVLELPGITGVSSHSSNNLFRGGNNQFPSTSACDPCDDKKDDKKHPFNDPFDDGFDDDLDDGFMDPDINTCTGLKTPYCNWVNEIGHAAINRVTFSVGGQVIDTVYGHYMHMWEELAGQPGKYLEEMIGKRMTRQQLVLDSSRDRRLYVPIPFYFTRHSGNSMPLVSLQFHSVQISVQLAKLESLIQVSDADVHVVKVGNHQPIVQADIQASLDTTYVYLDMEERDRFALGSFQQLVTQLQYFHTTSRSEKISVQLNFNHPCIELIWAVQRKCQADANNTFNYSGPYHTDPLLDTTLTINGLPRFCRESTYYRLKVPFECHTNIPKNFIYCYAFALKPEDPQPSGSLNFSRIDNAHFSATVNPNMSNTDYQLIIFARNYNILRFKEGLGGILFSN